MNYHSGPFDHIGSVVAWWGQTRAGKREEERDHAVFSGVPEL